MIIEFDVVGEALPAGSKATFPVLDKQGGLVRTKTGRILTRAKHANPKTADWMAAVAQQARKVYTGELLAGPIRLELWFYKPRPNDQYGTGRNAGKLKASAPEYPTKRPDVVKLARAVEDALTGVLWKDDSQGVTVCLHKRWGSHYHVRVIVKTL